MQQEVVSDQNRYRELSREHSHLARGWSSSPVPQVPAGTCSGRGYCSPELYPNEGTGRRGSAGTRGRKSAPSRR
jgi:hypothetical protein